MSDFTNVCNTFDMMGLKYTITELPNIRQLVIDNNQLNVDKSDNNVIWFEFDGSSGNFNMLCAEE